jgi:sirohydrochlorin cobaltochelatase
MMRSALILAAHGAGNGSAANRRLSALAQQLAVTTGFDEVAAAFHLGAPTYAEAVDELSATHVVVVPMMTSDGYYRRAVLPRGLSLSRRRDRVRVAITPALGTHPALPGLLARRVRDTLRDLVLEPRETAVVVVGHGAVRHPRSRAATVALCDALRVRSRCARVEAAFLSDAPRVEDVPRRVASPNLVAIPFLIGGGYHASVDIRQRLEVGPAATAAPDRASECPAPQAHPTGRRIVLVDPLGDDPEVGELVADLAARGLAALLARYRRASA